MERTISQASPSLSVSSAGCELVWTLIMDIPARQLRAISDCWLPMPCGFR
jgi:hypothetical protein